MVSYTRDPLYREICVLCTEMLWVIRLCEFFFVFVLKFSCDPMAENAPVQRYKEFEDLILVNY